MPQGGVAAPNPKRAPDGIAFTGNLNPTDPQEVHTLQDVPVTATGPGSECLNGWHENTDLFFCLANAISLDPRQSSAPAPVSTKAASTIILWVSGLFLGGAALRRQLMS